MALCCILAEWEVSYIPNNYFGFAHLQLFQLSIKLIICHIHKSFIGGLCEKSRDCVSCVCWRMRFVAGQIVAASPQQYISARARDEEFVWTNRGCLTTTMHLIQCTRRDEGYHMKIRSSFTMTMHLTHCMRWCLCQDKSWLHHNNKAPRSGHEKRRGRWRDINIDSFITTKHLAQDTRRDVGGDET